MGTVWVGEVQPTPVPMKSTPAAGFTHTHTMNPRVLSNTVGTCKPVQVFHFFHFDMVSFCFLVFYFVFYVIYSILYHVIT